MTKTEARAQLTAALARAKPDCFVPVSPYALAVLLAESESREGEVNDGDTDAQ